MAHFEDLIIIILLVVSTIISIIIFNLIYYKKSFFQINEELSNFETIKSGETKGLTRLYDLLEEKTNEQIMINNFHFNRKNTEYLYRISLVIFVPLIIYVVLMYDYSKNVEFFFVFFALSVFVSVLLVIYFIVCKFIGVKNLQLKSLIGIILSIFVKNLLLIFVTLTLFLLLLYFYILVDKNATMDLLNKAISNISSSETIFSIDGIKFSLSSLFFTLAIGGTVIFSITHHYLNDKKRMKEELEIQLEVYKKWYNIYENKSETILYLKVNDALNANKLNKFYDALTELRSNLNVHSIEILKIRIQRYDFFIYLIILSYFGGIFTILAPADFMNIIFFLFCLICGISIMLAYVIFTDYNNDLNRN